MPAILLTNIFAFVKVLDQFELKILANLVIMLNREDSYVRGSHAQVPRERRAEFSRACFLAFIIKVSFNTEFWAAYARTPRFVHLNNGI